MRVFETGRGGLEEIQEIRFKNEREIHSTIEKNLAVLFPDLELVKSEWTIKDNRIDTLAFDNRTKAFVIIEYKKARNSDIYSQGRTYYNTLRQNKDSCVLLLSTRRAKVMDSKDIDWDKTHLIFIMPSFTKRQIEASNSDDLLDIKLYEIHKYPTHLIVSRVDSAEPPHQSRPSSRLRSHQKSPISVYSEADWLAGKYGPKPLSRVRDLYFVLKNALIAQFQLEHFQRKHWAPFRLNGVEVCSVVLRKHKLQIIYSTSNKRLLPLNDFIYDVSKVRHLGRGNYCSNIKTESDVWRAMEYVASVCQDVSGSVRADSKPPTKSRPTAPVYSETDWLEGKCGGPKITPHARSLYDDLKRCLHRALPLEHVQKKKWASLRLKEGAEACSIILHQRRLEIVYATSKKSLWPPNDFVADISHVGHHGKGDYRSYIETESDIPRVMKYVEIVYKDITGSGPRYA